MPVSQVISALVGLHSEIFIFSEQLGLDTKRERYSNEY